MLQSNQGKMERKPFYKLVKSVHYTTLELKEKSRDLGILFEVSEEIDFAKVNDEVRLITQALPSSNQPTLARVKSEQSFQRRIPESLNQKAFKTRDQRVVPSILTVSQIAHFLRGEKSEKKSKFTDENLRQLVSSEPNLQPSQFPRQSGSKILSQMQQKQKQEKSSEGPKSCQMMPGALSFKEPNSSFMPHSARIEQPSQAVQSEMRAETFPQPQPSLEDLIADMIFPEIQPEVQSEPEEIPDQRRRRRIKKTNEKVLQNARSQPIIGTISPRNPPKLGSQHQPRSEAILPEIQAEGLPEIQGEGLIEIQGEGFLENQILPENELLPGPEVIPGQSRPRRVRKVYQKVPRNTRANPIIEIVSPRNAPKLTTMKSPKHKRTHTEIPVSRGNQLGQTAQEAAREQKGGMLSRLRPRPIKFE